MKRTQVHVIVGYLSITFATTAFGHGDMHDRIAALTRRIEAGEATTQLFLARAELKRLDGDLLAALADCSTVAQSATNNPALHFVRGKILFDQKKFGKAKAELDQVLASNPRHIEALVLRARAVEELRDYTAAVADYSSAIATANAPEPDWYFALARVLHRQGKTRDAISILDSGSTRLGNPISLQLLVLDFELELRNFDGALARVDTLITQSSRKEQWLLRRGEVLEQAGRRTEAVQAYQRAVEAFGTLPSRLQMSFSAKEARRKLLASLERLK